MIYLLLLILEKKLVTQVLTILFSLLSNTTKYETAIEITTDTNVTTINRTTPSTINHLRIKGMIGAIIVNTKQGHNTFKQYSL